jgi:hypothetical protein
MANLPVPPMVITGVMVIIYVIGGFFMDSMALIVVVVSIFFHRLDQIQF